MTRSRPRGIAASLLVTAWVVAGAALLPADAWAAGSVTVSGPDGSATADPEYATEVTVRGSGFQSIRNGFGGVYVLFGWVDAGSSWKPSAGGEVGADYRYVPDSEAQDNAGFQRFVAFPGSDTEGAAHAVMSDSGSWTVEMIVPGAVFESRDREGKVSEVDCREVTCGIITIGAHGVKNANNETFTPISFAAPASSSSSEGTTDGDPSPAAPAGIGDVRVGVVSGTVDAGTSIAFTGRGFSAGEQVVATLDDGLVSVGPLTAGGQGEVAGVLPVPSDARGGTHVLTLSGAASGANAHVEVLVSAPPPQAAPSADEPPSWLLLALAGSVALAAGLLVASVIVAIVRAARRRRARRAGRAVGAPPHAVAPPGDVAGADPVRDDAPTVELTAARS